MLSPSRRTARLTFFSPHSYSIAVSVRRTPSPAHSSPTHTFAHIEYDTFAGANAAIAARHETFFPPSSSSSSASTSTSTAEWDGRKIQVEYADPNKKKGRILSGTVPPDEIQRPLSAQGSAQGSARTAGSWIPAPAPATEEQPRQKQAPPASGLFSRPTPTPTPAPQAKKDEEQEEERDELDEDEDYATPSVSAPPFKRSLSYQRLRQEFAVDIEGHSIVPFRVEKVSHGLGADHLQASFSYKSKPLKVIKSTRGLKGNAGSKQNLLRIIERELEKRYEVVEMRLTKKGHMEYVLRREGQRVEGESPGGRREDGDGDVEMEERDDGRDGEENSEDVDMDTESITSDAPLLIERLPSPPSTTSASTSTASAPLPAPLPVPTPAPASTQRQTFHPVEVRHPASSAASLAPTAEASASTSPNPLATGGTHFAPLTPTVEQQIQQILLPRLPAPRLLSQPQTQPLPPPPPPPPRQLSPPPIAATTTADDVPMFIDDDGGLVETVPLPPECRGESDQAKAARKAMRLTAVKKATSEGKVVISTA